MEMDLDALSLKELKDMRQKIDRAIASFEERKKRDALQELEEVAKRHGFDIADLTETLSARKRGPAAPKYANPHDPDQTWTGRGRQPTWVKAALEAGRKLEDLTI